MATLLHLCQPVSAALERFDPGFEGGQQEFRCICASPKFAKWVTDDLPPMPSALGLESSPEEQLFDLVQLFCSDDVLTYGDHFKPLHSRDRGVWELRTPDLRIFGWFPIKDHFVAVVANDATFIKEHDLYEGYIGEVVRFRDQLDLDEPKFIQSERPQDVVSNYSQV
jgi:hypothetical protein